MKATNPATGELIRSYDELDAAAVEARLAKAAAAFAEHRRTSFSERAQRMLRVAEILEAEKQQFAELMTREMGKTLASAVAEAEKSAWGCRYYAENAAACLRDEDVVTNADRSYVKYQPLGVILSIMPWNFPFWQVFRFAAPAIMAGNVGMLKHASNVPGCALAIEDILRRAGFAEGVFQTLLVGSDRVAGIIEDPRIAAVTLTGSEAAGSAVASVAGKVIKKAVLELGGSDPFIVMPSADLDAAVETAVQARVINNGQSCIAAKRFIVADAIYAKFEERFVACLEALVVGDPMNDSTRVGPLATEGILTDLHEQVEASVRAGARLLTGGRRLERPGYFYAPTALADIPEAAPAYRDELFGPVASLFRVATIDEAIELANDTTFGLGSAAWTRDSDEQNQFIDRLEAGQVFINGMVASDPRLPFGGVKRSGFGRELGIWGIREFVNVKTVVVSDDGGEGNHGNGATAKKTATE